MKHSLLIFGGGILQKSLIRTAHKSGFRTIVIDPDKKAVSKSVADDFFVLPNDDFQSTLNLAKKFSVKGIVTAALENPLLMMSRIAEELSLSFPSYNSVNNSINKNLLKNCLSDNNIPCAQGILIKENENIILNSLYSLSLPLVVKPVDSSGSRGVITVKDYNNIFKTVDLAREYSKSGSILIEEYIDGQEISVESLTFGGKTTVVQITDKLTTTFPFNVEVGHTQPSILDIQAKEEVKLIIQKSIKALGLDNCATHTELKYNSSGPFILEIGPRLGGDFITSKLVPLSTGVNMEAALVGIATGKKPNFKNKKEMGSAIRYLQLKEGRVSCVGNWKDVKELEGIVDVNFSLKKGDYLRTISNSNDRYGFVIATGESRKDAVDRAQKGINLLNKKIKITGN